MEDFTVCLINVGWKAVPMDSQGMCPNVLREILSGWNVEQDSPRCVLPLDLMHTLTLKIRPQVMYTVPMVQNPTGSVCGSMQHWKPSLMLVPDHGTQVQTGHLQCLH
jgi:hypothetical protein